MVLPTLTYPDLGGTAVTDAIGYCLRSMGAAALIYPSARSDAETVVVDGIFRYAIGFNLLDFRIADAVRAEAGSIERFDDEGYWDDGKWQFRFEIADLSEDPRTAERFRGSWRFIGVVKAHEEFFAGGAILGGREGGEWEDVEMDEKGKLVKALRAEINKQTQ
jgi:hypothetical protein